MPEYNVENQELLFPLSIIQKHKLSNKTPTLIKVKKRDDSI